LGRGLTTPDSKKPACYKMFYRSQTSTDSLEQSTKWKMMGDMRNAYKIFIG
jgi:hypothetical protein